MRAFRPSHFSQEDDGSEDADRTKQINLQLYTQRAQAGLPLFVNPANDEMARGPEHRLGLTANG
jgi:hypothetical protein